MAYNSYIPNVNKIHFVFDVFKRVVTAFNYYGPVKEWLITDFDSNIITKNNIISEKQKVSAASSLVTDP